MVVRGHNQGAAFNEIKIGVDGNVNRSGGAAGSLRDGATRRSTASATKTGNGACVAFLVEYDMGHGLLEMEWRGMGLDSGTFCT